MWPEGKELVRGIGTWREAKAERHDEGQAVFFRGWVFRDPETEASVGYDDAGVVAAGILVLRAAGVSHRREVLQHEAFRPGEPLALTPEPSNPHDRHAVAIWDAGRERQVGYVPKELAPNLGARLTAGERLRTICLAEFVYGSGERCGIRVLVAPENFRLDLEPPTTRRRRRR